MKYIINAAGIVFFHQNKPIKIDKSSPQYLRVVKAFDLPESEQEQAIVEILDQTAGNFERDGFKITPDEVIYNNEVMPRALADKIRAIAQEGLPVSIFAKFWDNLNLTLLQILFMSFMISLPIRSFQLLKMDAFSLIKD